jgi:hypothetical protein
MIPKKQRLSDEELKKLIELYNNVKSNGINVKTLIRINCVIAWGKGWEWSTIEDILMVSKDVIDDAIGKYTLFVPLLSSLSPFSLSLYSFSSSCRLSLSFSYFNHLCMSQPQPPPPPPPTFG